MCFMNCQDEDINPEDSNEKQTVIGRELSLDRIPHLNQVSNTLDRISSDFNSSSSQRLSALDIDGISLVTDDILYMTYGNTHTYTFKLLRENPEFYIENLVLHYNIETEKYDEYLVQYNISAQEYLDFVNGIPLPENAETTIMSLDSGTFSDITNRGFWMTTCTTIYYNCTAGGNHSYGEVCQGDADQQPGYIEFCNSVYYDTAPMIDAGPSPGGGGGISGGVGDGYVITNPRANEPCESSEGVGIVSDEGCVKVKENEEDEDDCNTSKKDLKKVFPNMSDTNAKLLASVINDKGKDFGIDSDEDLWHFLSQAGHETGGFNTLNVTESTYWTTASKLADTYSKFTMDSLQASSNSELYYAPDYLQNSSGVANIAMCCRYGNGDVSSGDGYKYRGRGIFQLTWKDNYQAFKNWYNDKYEPDIDPVTSPSIVASNDTLAILSGLWYYKTRVVDKITIDSTTTVKKVTKPINSARKGLADRKARFKKAKDSINCL